MSKIDLLIGLQGFRDYYPEYWKELNLILSAMKKISTEYGYTEYEGPSLERVELIEAKSGTDLMKEIFILTDRSDNRLLLRPEQTPTLARMLAKEQQRYKRPIRWFSIPRLFRDETVQKGREREFWQLNVDILGEDEISADAEVIAIAVDIIREVGLADEKFDMIINHRELLNSFIKGISDVDPQLLIPVIDKRLSLIQNEVGSILTKQGKTEREANDLSLLYRRILISSSEFKEKLLKESTELHDLLDEENEISEEVMINEFVAKGLNEEQAQRLYSLTNIRNSPSEFIAEIKEIDLPPECESIISKLEKLGRYLEAFGVGNTIIFDASLARGLDYYTGVVFEAFDSTGEIVRAILGGGRYDDLVSDIGGSALSGVGFGMGELVLLELAKLNNVIISESENYELYLAPIKEESIPFILQMRSKLRKHFKIICNPFSWRLKRHFQFADENNCKLVLLAGPKDIEQNQVSIRKVDSGENFTFKVDKDLNRQLRNLLK
ncbi:MAG: histidine--tRNA ligase [Candidatus Heimdallarchaeota archaeon]|nr:histidine--tRNA ligase [Candidatus Heimdallarchaeota archaeon]